MRLALFGGTFDPIHKAHLAIARSAADHFHLDRVLFVPAAHPPHKAGVTHAPYEDRVRMAELACAGEPRFEVSRLEEATERSYSIDTIEKLRARLAPRDELFFIIGADAFAEIRTWHRWRDVAAAVRFLVVSRPGHAYDTPPEVRAERLDTVELPVSSSEIRRKLAAGLRPAQVPDAVLNYIAEKGLYAGNEPAS
jgi:nicotinate-nucleotide adenylyltransferase